mmetsp:Transcript_16116/g.36129  ORF Transcript_16116/g.36129 Transcript_16116/m.36129 type:complete len:113 (+) Transcript_16116:491-829(+)
MADATAAALTESTTTPSTTPATAAAVMPAAKAAPPEPLASAHSQAASSSLALTPATLFGRGLQWRTPSGSAKWSYATSDWICRPLQRQREHIHHACHYSVGWICLLRVHQQQ